LAYGTFALRANVIYPENVIGNTAPRQKEEDRMEKRKILKSPRPKKPGVHAGLKKFYFGKD